MNVLALCCLILLLCSTVLVGSGSYGVDYKKSGTATEYGGQAYHGCQSALLRVYEGKTYSKIRMYLNEPLMLQELDDFIAKIRLLNGNDGRIKVELYLDGNGDGTWKSKSSDDVKLYANIYPWTEDGVPVDGWSDLNVTYLEYKKYRYASLGEKSLEDWDEESSVDLELVKAYITLYKKGVGGSSCIIDYIRINDMVLSFEPNEGPYMKEGKPSRVTPGYKLTYTITYGNDLTTPVNNLKVVEHYDLRTGIVSVDPPPDPGTNNIWTIGTLQPGEYGQIKIVMRAMKQSCKADIYGQVRGTGYVSVRRRFTTERSGHIITNKVTISCDQFNRSAVVETPVKPVTERSVTFAEHGSGDYESSEDLDYRSYKMIMKRDLNASGSGSMINVSRGRPLVYNASWHARHVCVDQKRRLLLSEEIFYADRLDCEGSAEVRSTRSTLESLSNFSGLAIYEIGSDTKTRDAGIADVLQGSFSVRTRGEVYK